MRAKLERAIQLTEQDTAESMTAEKAQKAFVLEWELSGLFGSATAYIVGKVWNDVLTGQEGAAFYGFKTDHPMIFALFATAICVGFSIATSAARWRSSSFGPSAIPIPGSASASFRKPW